MTISEILLKYKTDKNYGKISPKEGHYYGDSYDNIFKRFNKDDNLNILEIGTQKGGSLLAWKEFFKNSKITGVDIVDVVLDEYRNNTINYIVSDIKSEYTFSKLKDEMFDIIIDDGSHHLDDVIYVVKTYLKNINDNGVLIIEDCQSPEVWVSEINSIITEEFNITTSDLRNINHHYDDYLIIIEKNKK